MRLSETVFASPDLPYVDSEKTEEKEVDLKYEFTGETKTLEDGTVVKRIRFLKDLQGYKKGENGGWIQDTKNLSHLGECVVINEAIVCGMVAVTDNAIVSGSAKVIGNKIPDSIEEERKVYFGMIRIKDRSHIYGDAEIRGEDILIDDNASVGGKVHIGSGTTVCDNARIDGNDIRIESSLIKGDASIMIDKYCPLIANAVFNHGAVIINDTDFLIMGPLGSERRTATFYKNKYGYVSVSTGCFEGPVEVFRRRVRDIYGDYDKNPDHKRYYASYLMACNTAEHWIEENVRK